MPYGWQKDRYVRKPILGFGWAGIVASIVFCLVLIAHRLGFDFQYMMLVGIHRVLGIDAVYFVVTNIMPFCLYSLTDPVFGPAEMFLVLIAFGIAPVRLGWWRYGLVIGMGIVMPIAALRLALVFYGNHNFLSSFITPDGFIALPIAITMAKGVIGIITAGVLWSATRSKLVLACLLSSAVVAFMDHWLHGLGSVWFGKSLSFNIPHTLCLILLAGSILTWAIRLRINWPIETACDDCGYDLRGLRDSVCPECGTEHQKQLVETPPTPS